MADSVPPRLETVRVAFLRDPKAPPPDEQALERAGIEAIDLALPSGDEQVIVFMIQALSAGCDAVVLDLEIPQEELAGRLQAEADVPVVYASHASLILNLGRTLASLALHTFGHVDARLPQALPPTIYSRTGDWPALITVVFLALFSLFLRWISPRH